MTHTASTARTHQASHTTHGETFPLGGPWPGIDPFLFTMHHLDHYPAGDEHMGPIGGVAGRPLGQDFGNPAGWNMYHGAQVPGFPAHPHRGFETITVVMDGVVDHADSTGAGARYSDGDVQWVTAGDGVNHSEMFPLVERDADNTLDLYQIWINLPAASKRVPAEFKMLWNEDIPVVDVGENARVKVIAGRFGDAAAPAPPLNSWASNPDADVTILLIQLDPGATVTLPATGRPDTNRVLYVHGEGAAATVDGAEVGDGWGFAQTAPGELTITTAERPATVLVLQGAPIGEPVAQRGPFVMNTEAEVAQAFADYRQTGFGGWPHATDAPVFPRDQGRFARHGDGRLEDPASRR